VLTAGIVSLAAFAFSAASASAVTIHTSSFITGPANFDGFERLGLQFNLPNNTVYSEGRVHVEYVGTGDEGVTTWFPYHGEGNYSWYESGGGNGYTDITLATGHAFREVQFQAASGFGPGASTGIEFRLLKNGSVVDQGFVGFTTPAGQAFDFYGFSGGVFDEVQLQSIDGDGPFDPTGYDAIALDSISIATGAAYATPIPSTLPLLAAGLGGLGFVGWRRKTVAAVYPHG
jgi:hypothetical protein